jgi:2-haloacid dehalogenase
MIRSVLLDLDDTILDFHRAERAALRETLAYLDIDPAEATLARYSELNRLQWEALERGEITREEVKVRRYRLLFAELGVERDPRAAAEYYEKELAVGHYFVEGAESLLQALRGRWRLYLVSNGTVSVQRSRLQSAGIAGYFTKIFLSEAIGCDKPGAAFFQRCFDAIPDFCREETVIVGDSLTSDIRGGHNAGIRTIWFNPSGGDNRTDVRPDYEIRTLAELPPLLERL